VGADVEEDDGLGRDVVIDDSDVTGD